MGVRVWVKKLQRAFPEINAGYLTVDTTRVVNVTRGGNQVRLHFAEPNQWRITSDNGIDDTFPQEERAFILAVQLLAHPDEQPDLIAHVELGDQLWRETGDGTVSMGMMDLRERMVEEVVVRKNDDLFEYRRVPDEPELLMRIPIQCEPGWYQLIGNCLDSIHVEMQAMEWKDYRLKISCVKEKFAGLRIYFNITAKDGHEISSATLQCLHNSISNHLAVAETLAHTTCETCGKVGKIHGTVGEHLQTLCEHHAKLRKRSETPVELETMFSMRGVDGLHFIKLIQEQKENDELRIRRDGSPQDGADSPA